MDIAQSDKKGVQYIVASLAGLGIDRVVICPGSRNAPLTISFNRHPAFDCISVRDERSAAFIALGMAIELKKPVAVVCTSGSAAINFAPAIAEAFYQRIPLIILTADRPKAWTDQGDGQTINQTEVFRNFIRKSYELNGDAQHPDELWTIQRSVSEGFAIAMQHNRGPVHFNIPVSEPLYGIQDRVDAQPRIHRSESFDCSLPEGSKQHFRRLFSESKNVLILAGQMYPNALLQQQLADIAQLPNVVVLTETTSNLRHPSFIENIDRCITSIDASQEAVFAPDLLITIGAAVVSKRIKSFLRKNKPRHHWNIDAFDSSMDTYQSLTTAIAMNAHDFFSQTKFSEGNTSSTYAADWHQMSVEKQQLHNAFLERSAFSDLKAFQSIFEKIPESYAIHLSNSSPIRYAQLFTAKAGWEFYCNRGTSGIDGCTSTAVGAALGAPHKNFLLITGDVAFAYDINGLWNELPLSNLKIIMINNQGGNIFRLIPGPDTVAERETFFETKMTSDASRLADHFNWKYLTASNSEALRDALSNLFNTDGRAMLEVFTDAEINAVTLKQYWQSLNRKNL